MTTKAAMLRLLAYNDWANHRILRAVATLTVDEYRRDMKSSHGGVRGTLAHTLGAEWIWLERWKGVSPIRGIDEAEFPDVMALRERWNRIQEHREVWARSLGENAGDDVIRYTNLAGQPNESPLLYLVQHQVNHSSYHRGQVITFIRQLGGKAVGTDMVTWDRERTAKAEG